ncbi:MAG: hypothetical protein O3B76_06165 [Proteobacteria bacterium]|nr:hypothetical protein [Pseudomonadota bacterium]MDA1022335.1 hypothetical protein [Pseudomonadota bacterium]
MFNSTQASFPSLLGAAMIASALLLSGCTQTAGLLPTKSTGAEKGAKEKRMSSQFNDLPIPKGATMNVEKTVVVGSETWFGQLSLDTNHNASTMFDFYERELGSYGWRKLTSVRAATSILSYDRQDRVLTIAIQPGRILGSTITVTVSPKEKPPAPAFSAPTPAPAISPYPAPSGTLRPPAPAPRNR